MTSAQTTVEAVPQNHSRECPPLAEEAGPIDALRTGSR